MSTRLFATIFILLCFLAGPVEAITFAVGVYWWRFVNGKAA